MSVVAMPDGRRGGKREQIVAAARQLFLSDGLIRTSMDALAKQANVSKATLYSHFDSKEALFVEIMETLCADTGGEGILELPMRFAPQVVLLAAGGFVMDRLYSDDGIALLRTAIGDARQMPELGTLYWQTGPARLDEYLQAYFTALLAAEPGWRFNDALSATQGFYAELTGARLIPLLLGVQAPLSPSEREAQCSAAVTRFLTRYQVAAA